MGHDNRVANLTNCFSWSQAPHPQMIRKVKVQPPSCQISAAREKVNVTDVKDLAGWGDTR
jgi:hypothetical protein